ncbi:N-acetyl-gamma-glutamyl-phosphate reductase [Chloroflexota bacterium]
MSKINAGIINVTGYAGIELARLLSRHPQVHLVSVTGRSAAGQQLGDIFPHLSDIKLTIAPELGEVDVAFSAMPHTESAEVVIPLVGKGVKVVDLSADFRLHNPADYPLYYGYTHPAQELLASAAFGLTELYRPDVASAKLVANPGCYPTGAILALAPALKNGIIKPDIIVDSKSGLSGSGRSLSFTSHFSEANDNVCAYALTGHRHHSEILQEAKQLSGSEAAQVTFVPHLVPMTRGIHTTAYAPLTKEIDQAQLLEIYEDFYKNDVFLRVMKAPVQTKHTWGSNYCHIHPTLDLRAGRFIVTSAIDNLVKGAAGQAIQNMNVMLGLPETAGLEAAPIFP